MTDLETRLRSSLQQVADDTIIPQLDLDPNSLQPRPDPSRQTTNAQAAHPPASASLGAYVRNHRILSVIAVGIAVVVVTGGTAALTHHLDDRPSAADTPPAPSGIVEGQLPLCYGPGPNLNLSPRTTVQVMRNGHIFERRTFPSSIHHKTYRLVLPAGSYVLHTYAKPDLQVVVKAGKTVTANFTWPGCI